MAEATLPLDPFLQLYIEFLAFLVGATVGSFLNVVIARLPEGLSVVSPRSRCPKCKSPIRAIDNIPILSWLVLRGRCRNCGNPISIRYPTVELVGGLLGLAVYRSFGLSIWSVCAFLFVALLVAITYIDLDEWIIPHELTIPGMILGVVSSFFTRWNPNAPQLNWLDSVIGIALGYGTFALIAGVGWLWLRLRHDPRADQGAMGQGDWPLTAMICGFLGWKALLPVILLSSLQGSIVGLLLMALGRAEKGTPVVPADSDASQLPASTPPAAPAAGPHDTTVTAPEGNGTLPEATGPATSTAPRADAVEETEAETEEEAEEEAEEEEWIPPKNSVPFGPFLSLAALEQLFLGDWLRMQYEHLLAKLIG